jgi:hypothetical protein
MATLAALDGMLLSNILSFAAADAASLCRVGACSTSLHRALGSDGGGVGGSVGGGGGDEEVWRSLCQLQWRVSDERFAQWPSISSWRTLYRVLEEWAPREGFYVLLEGSPWGLLLLLRFVGGDFVGEALFPEQHTSGAFERTVVLRVSFSDADGPADDGCRAAAGAAAAAGGGAEKDEEGEEDDEGAGSAAQPPPRRGPAGAMYRVSVCGEPAWVQALGPCLAAGAGRGADAGTARPPPNAEVLPFLVPYAVPAHRASARALRLVRDTAHNSSSGGSSGGSSSVGGLLRGLWAWATASADQRRDASADAALTAAWAPHGSAPVAEMVRRLWSFSSAGLTLDWVDGPTRLSAGSFAYSAGMPVIRPGLYSGAYHPEMYGKFCREVVLVEYRQYSLGGSAKEEAWARIRAEVFNHPEQADGEEAGYEAARGAVEASGAEDAVFVIGRKVTGDMHVCMGRATWAAVVHPPIACADLEQITDRGGAGAAERVARRWWGCGTLAYPGFRTPSWSPGTLVQLEGPDGSDRFGFVWMRDDDATVLTWLDEQDSFPWIGDE